MVYLPDMSLLTPTEAHAFQSFLTAVDYSVNQEWGSDPGKLSLTKATKDLMSLDAVKWGNPPRDDSESPYCDDESMPSPHSLFHQQHLISALKAQNQPPLYTQHSPSISIAPLRTVSAPSPPHPDDVPSSSSSPASIPMSVSPPTPYDYYPPQTSTSKRPSVDESQHTSNKRFRPSHHNAPTIHPSTHLISGPPPKPALLSPSQKKANHIQSEQKRRANIRRGYEALCETVPALREAIRLEEEAGGRSGSGGSGGKAPPKGKKKGKAKFANDDGEKMDGRAGPRSENIVLQKSQSFFYPTHSNI
jgi:hypothetical protein